MHDGTAWITFLALYWSTSQSHWGKPCIDHKIMLETYLVWKWNEPLLIICIFLFQVVGILHRKLIKKIFNFRPAVEMHPSIYWAERILQSHLIVLPHKIKSWLVEVFSLFTFECSFLFNFHIWQEFTRQIFIPIFKIINTFLSSSFFFQISVFRIHSHQY